MARKVELISPIRMHPMMTMSPTYMNKLMIYIYIYDSCWADYPKVESSFHEYPFFKISPAQEFHTEKYVM
jgi:hypothetical protein